MDRWSIASTLNYLPHEVEMEIVAAKMQPGSTTVSRETIDSMIRLADLPARASSPAIFQRSCRRGQSSHGWKMPKFSDVKLAFRLSFLNKCDEMERLSVNIISVALMKSWRYRLHCRGQLGSLTCHAQDDGDNFLRSTAACLRAMSGSEREVRFSGTQTIISPTEVRLPAPARSGNPGNRQPIEENQGRLRGAADDAAVWIAHHNDGIHNRLAPMAPPAGDFRCCRTCPGGSCRLPRHARHCP